MGSIFEKDENEMVGRVLKSGEGQDRYYVVEDFGGMNWGMYTVCEWLCTGSGQVYAKGDYAPAPLRVLSDLEDAPKAVFDALRDCAAYEMAYYEAWDEMPDGAVPVQWAAVCHEAAREARQADREARQAA